MVVSMAVSMIVSMLVLISLPKVPVLALLNSGQADPWLLSALKKSPTSFVLSVLAHFSIFAASVAVISA